MWIFAKTGFVSIVQDYNSDGSKLLVRARVREDLENFLLVTATTSLLEILETPESDYRYRVSMPKYEARNIVEILVAQIDYTNFKNKVHDGTIRDDVYGAVWASVGCLQPGGPYGSQLPSRQSVGGSLGKEEDDWEDDEEDDWDDDDQDWDDDEELIEDEPVRSEPQPSLPPAVMELIGPALIEGIRPLAIRADLTCSNDEHLYDLFAVAFPDIDPDDFENWEQVINEASKRFPK